MNKTIGILVGSLRQGSFSRSIANEIASQIPETHDILWLDIADLPLYNQDLDTPEAQPASWVAFRDKVRSADAFLFVTPEYNRSVPAALKNALDIASRPMVDSCWNGKPAAIVSVSPGALGGFGANHHLRQSFTVLNMPTMQQPEAYVGGVVQSLNEKGQVDNEKTKSYLKNIVNSFVSFIDRF